MSRGVGRIVKKVWKNVGGHRRYVGLDAKGRWKFLKHPKSSKSSSKKSKTKTKKGSVKRTTTKRRRSTAMTIPIAIVGPLAGSMVYPIKAAMAGRGDDAMQHIVASYTGFDYRRGNFDAKRLYGGLIPLLLGATIHKFVGGPPLNINRVLGRAKVPLLRI